MNTAVNRRKITRFVEKEMSCKLLVSCFLILVLLIRIYYFNYFSVPDSDFFDLRMTAMSFLNLTLPESYQRLPLYSLLIGLLSTILPGNEPFLFAAELINLVAFLASSVLLYFISKRFLGKTGFVVVYLFALHPLTIHMTCQPRAEMLTVMFVLLGIYLAHRVPKSPYLAGFLASLTRYEGFLLIPSLALRNLVFSKRRLLFVVLGLLSSAGMLIWLALNYRATGHINPYYQYFAPDMKPAGLDYLRVTMQALVNFLQFRITHFIPLTFLTIVLLLLTTIGAWSFLKKSFEDALPLLIFFVGCTMLNLIFFSPTSEHAFVTIWVIFLTVFGGLQYVSSSIGPRIQGLMITFTCPPYKTIMIPFYLIISLLSLLVFKQTMFLELPSHFKVFCLASLGIGIWFVFINTSGSTWAGLFVRGILILFLAFISCENTKATQTTLNRTKSTKAELRLTGEWYSQNANEGDKIVVAEPWVVSYYANKRNPRSFVYLGSFKAQSPLAFINEAREKGIHYVVWNSTHGTRDKNSYYYKKYKIFLISQLGEGKDTKHFRLVKTLREGRSYAYLFELI